MECVDCMFGNDSVSHQRLEEAPPDMHTADCTLVYTSILKQTSLYITVVLNSGF